MSEILEAEAFSRELDNLLAGKPSDAAGELAADLEFAAALRRSDLSAQSRMKAGLKADLLARPRQGRVRRVYSWMTAHPRLLSGGAVAAVLIAIPMTKQLIETRRIQPGGEVRLFAAKPFEHEQPMPVAPGSGMSLIWIAPKGVAANGGKDSKSDGRALGQMRGMTTGQSTTALDNAAAQAMPSGDVVLSAPRPSPVNGRLNGGGKFGSLGGMQTTFALPGIPPAGGPDREGYASIVENSFQTAADHPLSTFSIDVDAASYSNIRRYLNGGSMPPKDAVRVEEMINYFRYEYPEPKGDDPFSITAESADCPWNDAHRLVRIGLKGKAIAKADLPPSNLVFLIDSSGSMMDDDKLPLLKRGLRLLVDQLRPQDRISIVTYAGAAGLVLPTTPGSDKERIIDALDQLEAGGSTAGGAGLQLAYQVASRSFLKNGLNRVILATDGDFNVGVTSDGELVRLIEKERESGVFLTVLGFGTGNYQDAKMKQLADHGNGNYAYVDDILEARRVLVREMGATLMTIAKDVKIQVEFNPARVQAYRLIGYESRLLKAEDFNNDKKDAGELGSGHTVTALYEVVPVGAKADVPTIDPLKYQKPRPSAEASASGELLTVKFRYKKPDGDKSRLIVRALNDEPRRFADMSDDFRFAASAAGFGMLLHGSSNAGNLDYAKVRRMAKAAKGADDDGYRAEFIRLVEKAEVLSGGGANPD